MSAAENKIATQHVEDFDKVQDAQHDFEDLPESLRELSSQELSKLGKWTTLKLDCIIMPALTILYILYDLPETQLLCHTDGSLEITWTVKTSLRVSWQIS